MPTKRQKQVQDSLTIQLSPNSKELVAFLESDKSFVRDLDFVINGMMASLVAQVKTPDPDRNFKETAQLLQSIITAKAAASSAWSRISGIEEILVRLEQGGQIEIREVRKPDTNSESPAPITIPDVESFGDDDS